jgi:hypothetical protein
MNRCFAVVEEIINHRTTRVTTKPQTLANLFDPATAHISVIQALWKRNRPNLLLADSRNQLKNVK